MGINANELQHKMRQQGEYESLYRDMMVHFGNWDQNPFPQNEGRYVCLWQGHEDKLVPFELQRFLARQLSWIRYHEVPDGGHFIIHENYLYEIIFRKLLLGEEPKIK
ncbi:hypothetical protein PIB30_065545 [Stylosanthes scabra]|uniref:Uncharacterized protein n=1 Tax=Stylosanthes scabra TaxID=79078 RepID=A0ABU6UN24_9FABA|nr:hypothetical protein [Stylosanthes scabra]